MSLYIPDITYESMAKAFDQELLSHEETKRRMNELSKHRKDINNSTPEQNKARDRMALFPAQAEVLFVDPELWVVSALLKFAKRTSQT
jgi:molybdopterin-biosynthesis enzyme MoeA-like protein